LINCSCSDEVDDDAVDGTVEDLEDGTVDGTEADGTFE
jgi:hypothetical protein